MFRQASLLVGAIVLIAGIHCRPSVCKAWDDVKPGPRKEMEAEKAEIVDPDKFDKFDLGDIEDTPPAELDVDPTLKKPAQEVQVVKPVDGLDPNRHTTGYVKPVEHAVNAALVWLANHQLADGSWSLHDYTKRCKDKTCTGQSNISSDAGATALGLLPFLAAGLTHKSKWVAPQISSCGRRSVRSVDQTNESIRLYPQHIGKGIEWLIRHQHPDGNLANGSTQMMYGHGLATIALSEAYAISGDKQIGAATQKGVNFILAAQNPNDGGWRYNPKDPGDTSVTGWQLAALKSAKMAGLNVGGSVFSAAGKWLDSVAVHEGAEYGYQPGGVSSTSMTAVGLLGRQYLGIKRDSPMLAGGMKYLMNNLPDETFPNIYYWYYATQVMHNMSGYEWDTWNRKMRDLLVRTQVRNADSCANGSWDPGKDVWGNWAGRVMQTSLSALTLEVYYRYLPIFKTQAMPSEETDKGTSESAIRPKENGAAKPAGKADADPFGPAKASPDSAPPPVPPEKPIREAQAEKPRDEQQAFTPGGGGNKAKVRTAVGALIWLANHQAAGGSWSLHDYTKQCKDKTCTGQSDVSSDAGATALGLLPFLAAGQTQKSRGPYKDHINRGLDWLIRHQQPDGNLAKGSNQMMYGHGLATIALSEAYGLTGDSQVGQAAQGAVNFILAAQNSKDGGWRYNPKDPGDTCVLGWQLTALKSAHMAGLKVGRAVFVNAGKYLDSVATRDGTEYGYQPGMVSSPTMTAVGLLGRQYLGVKRDSAMLTGGMKYLMNRLPDEKVPNTYYWYYGTYVMHNMSGTQWDTWNHKIRDILVRTQVRDVNSCAAGSWDPAKDLWGRQGGRVMTTSLSTLTLLVYYRYLPIFRNTTTWKENEAEPAKPAENADADPFGPAKPNPDSAPPAVPQKKPAKDAGNDPFG